VINFGGAAIFHALEPGMTYTDAFYHCVMTATTIGLGDIAPQTQSGRAYGIIHMVASVVLLGSIMGTILESLGRRVAVLKKERMLRRQLDSDLLVTLDRDGDGIDKAEFVLGMLELIEVISKDDYMPFLRQFHEMDKSGDGRLTRDDLVQLAAESKRKAAEQEEFRQANRSQADIAAERLNGHALELVVPTFISVFGFLWNSTFGYLLCASGLLRGLAIGSILGLPPCRQTYKKVAVPLGLSAVVTLVTLGLILSFVFDPVWYMTSDPLMTEVFYGHLSNGYTVPFDDSTLSRIKNRLAEKPVDGLEVFLFLLYCLYFLYTAGVDIMSIFCLYMKNNGKGKHPPAAGPAPAKRDLNKASSNT